MMEAVETLSRMLTPQIMLPVQLKSEPDDLPEFGLLRAVLLSAVVDYVDSFKASANPQVALRRREARKAAESWFAGDPWAPIEFELCCAMFGVSADQMRVKIKLLTKRLSAPLNWGLAPEWRLGAEKTRRLAAAADRRLAETQPGRS
jgi:hypothetical protein